jgi:predicted nucleic-acid-binding protein
VNVLLRFLMGDDPVQSPEAKALFKAATLGKITLIIPTPVIQETVYVLEKLSRITREEIAPAILSVLNLPNVANPDGRWVMDAIQQYRLRKADFGDALACAYASHLGHSVVTYDQGMMKIFPEMTPTPPARWLSKK